MCLCLTCPVSIPYTGFDHGEWKTYPERQDYYDRSVLQCVDPFQEFPTDFETFLERWLFWAALEKILQQGPLHSSLLSERLGPGRYVIRISEAVYRKQYNQPNLLTFTDALLLHDALRSSDTGDVRRNDVKLIEREQLFT